MLKCVVCLDSATHRSYAAVMQLPYVIDNIEIRLADVLLSSA
jgi:hypothetical protein